MKRNKKGFTIIELVVVIAVIAILAAVLIPTFSNIIKKANESVDIQAAKQMNDYIAIAEVDADMSNISAVMNALSAEKLEIENYKPLTSDRAYYWVKSINRIVYIDTTTNEVLYPDNLTTLVKKAGDWYSLNGSAIGTDSSWKDAGKIDNDGKLEVSSAGMFFDMMQSYSDSDATAKTIKTIDLKDDIDLAGATGNFGNVTSNGKLTINGNGKTIYAFRSDKNSFYGTGEYANTLYAGGMFATIKSGAEVTIENVTIDGMVIENTGDGRAMGLIAGYINGTLALKNVTFKNCYVKGVQKVGGIAGYMNSAGGSLTVENVKFENTTVAGIYQAAKLVGVVTQGNSLTVQGDGNDFSGISVVGWGVESFGKSDITIKADKPRIKLGGAEDNTYCCYDRGSSLGLWVFGQTTNDWAWLQMDVVLSLESDDRTKCITYNQQDCTLENHIYSASENINNGKPASMPEQN